MLRPQSPSCDIGAFEVEAGSITINKVAKGGAAYRVFTFRFDDLKFRLGDGQSETFDNLPADDYVVSEDEAHGFFLQDLVCRDGQSTFDYDSDDRQVTIHLAPGEDVECTHEREGLGTRHPDAREPHRGSAVRRFGRPGGEPAPVSDVRNDTIAAVKGTTRPAHNCRHRERTPAPKPS